MQDPGPNFWGLNDIPISKKLGMHIEKCWCFVG